MCPFKKKKHSYTTSKEEITKKDLWSEARKQIIQNFITYSTLDSLPKSVKVHPLKDNIVIVFSFLP